jgi:hypothetical protein
MVQQGCGVSEGFGGSVKDMVAQKGMWWLSCLRQLGDTRLQHSSSGFDPGFTNSLMRDGRNMYRTVYDK